MGFPVVNNILTFLPRSFCDVINECFFFVFFHYPFRKNYSMDLYQVRPSQFIRVQHSLNTRELLLGKIKQEMPDELIKELCKHISQDLQVGIFILFRCFFFVF
jgi:hypothetical protein